MERMDYPISGIDERAQHQHLDEATRAAIELSVVEGGATFDTLVGYFGLPAVEAFASNPDGAALLDLSADRKGSPDAA